MITITKYKPCLEYESPFDKEEGQTIKLKKGRTAKEGKIGLMTGSTAREVLYTIKAFKNKAEDASLSDNELMTYFMQCLGSKARDKWAQMMNWRGPNNQFELTKDGWDDAKEAWILEYVKDTNAKETIIAAWSSTRDYFKPKEIGIDNHADRIEFIKQNFIALSMFVANRSVLWRSLGSEYGL